MLALTAAGRTAFRQLDRGAAEQWSTLLADLPDADQRRLLGAMRAVEEVLDGGPPRDAGAEVVLRDPRSGDYGWIVARHGELYAQEHGWGLGFEALVARVVADFAAGADQRFGRAWIAEVAGAPAGCVLSVDGDEPGDAKLRLLLVEPWARGLGVGGRLIDAVVAHARARGARRVVLWTNDPLVEARRLYERRGFALIAQERHADWGVPLTGQVLALELEV
ncbi:acetyltransferase [Baekduia alba]|uniref:GNAT family N-acetyltransferase n=1 Tax=Baekduia alba TaxID=2997333 RepID=UPI0023406362|nr:GNAT family N-acetyltransferase [Baekduia alba]WCB94552.1 acetyltransferase [Baekduia alba]